MSSLFMTQGSCHQSHRAVRLPLLPRCCQDGYPQDLEDGADIRAGNPADGNPRLLDAAKLPSKPLELPSCCCQAAARMLLPDHQDTRILLSWDPGKLQAATSSRPQVPRCRKFKAASSKMLQVQSRKFQVATSTNIGLNMN